MTHIMGCAMDPSSPKDPGNYRDAARFGEQEVNREDREDEEPCDVSYDDDGACERSYYHFESEDDSYDGDGTYYASDSKDEDNVHVESVDTPVDPIDDQIDSSSKIGFCPPSIDTPKLRDSS
uniref:Uncharacterized protein n=1 Tax=Solanum tuberosum TaxID=4113 RepID=M1DEH0_SOLTU